MERYISRWRENGQIARGKFGGHKKHLLAAHAERIRKLVTAAPDLTLAALCQRSAAQGIKVSTSALDRFVRPMPSGPISSNMPLTQRRQVKTMPARGSASEDIGVVTSRYALTSFGVLERACRVANVIVRFVSIVGSHHPFRPLRRARAPAH